MYIAAKKIGEAKKSARTRHTWVRTVKTKLRCSLILESSSWFERGTKEPKYVYYKYIPIVKCLWSHNMNASKLQIFGGCWFRMGKKIIYMIISVFEKRTTTYRKYSTWYVYCKWERVQKKKLESSQGKREKCGKKAQKIGKVRLVCCCTFVVCLCVCVCNI